MIAVSAKAPPFELMDQFGRTIRSEYFLGKKHIMLASYPLDFTPT